MTLDLWLNNAEMNAERFGRLIGVTGQAVRRYRTGERMPDAETIERIRQATNGDVTVTEIHATRMGWLKQQQTNNSEASAA